jgi:hypothetical protein
MEQIKGETVFRQQIAQENAEISSVKDTRGLADLVNGKAIKNQIEEVVEELTLTKSDLVDGKVPASQLPTPMFSEIVSVAVPTSGVLDLTSYNNKVVKIIDTGVITSELLNLTLPFNIQVWFDGTTGEAIANIQLNVGTQYNDFSILHIPEGYNPYGYKIISGSATIFYTSKYYSNLITKIGAEITLLSSSEL